MEKKKGFFGRISDKVGAKLKTLNTNTVGWIILATIGLIAVGVFLVMISGLIDVVRDQTPGEIPGILISFVLGMAFLFGLGAMIFHMMKTLNEELRFKTDYSVEKFQELRIAAGKGSGSSAEEDQKCIELLDQMVDSWTDVETENGQNMHYPKNMKEIVKARKLLVQVIAVAPTDRAIVDRFVNYAQIVKEKTDRQFDGSGLLLGLSAIMSLGVIIMGIVGVSGGGGIGALIGTLLVAFILWGIPCGIYFLACRTPGFMLEFRKDKKPSRFKLVNAVIAIVFGAGLAGLAANTGGNTKWYTVFSDGRRERDYGMEMNSMMMSLAIKGFLVFCVLMILFFISLSVVLWAFINYLRNYVIFK